MAKSNPRSGTSNLKPFYLLIGLIVVVGAVLMVYGARRGSGNASVEPVNLEALDAQALLEKAKGVRLGPDTAPVQLLVFSDYMCPACASFAANIEPLVKQEFVETGKVQLIAYDFPLGGSHVHSFLAARASRCAEDQGKYWDYHRQLLGQQSSWSFSRVPPVEQFREFAEKLALDTNAFDTCLNSDAHAELVTANYQLGQQLGVNATPTVFIAGRQSLGPNDWDVLRSEILRALGE